MVILASKMQEKKIQPHAYLTPEPRSTNPSAISWLAVIFLSLSCRYQDFHAFDLSGATRVLEWVGEKGNIPRLPLKEVGFCLGPNF